MHIRVAEFFRAALVMCYLICECSPAVLHPPRMSLDVYTFEGDALNPSIDIECLRPSLGWGDYEFVQLFKFEIDFQRVNGHKEIRGTNSRNELNYIVAVNHNLRTAYSAFANRYSVLLTEASLKLTILNPVAEDSGIFMCRTTLVDSSQVDIENATSLTRSNVTIVEPVSQLMLFTARADRDFWKGTINFIPGIHITLDTDSPTRFGCSVRYNTGLPTLTGYWVTAEDVWEPVDVSVWQFEDGLSESTTVHPSGAVVTNNASVVYWASVGADPSTDIPNIGVRDGSRFVCEATFEGLPRMPRSEVAVFVGSSTPTEPPTTTTTTTMTTTTSSTNAITTDDSTSMARIPRPHVLVAVVAYVSVLLLDFSGFL